MATYVCSDIHGWKSLYDKARKTIPIKTTDTLYILGDAIDRGPDGTALLKDIFSRKNTHMFIGNHEFMMLNALREIDEANGIRSLYECRTYYKMWTERNGGDKTWQTFKQCRKETREQIREQLLDSYLYKKIEINGQKFCLSHTGLPGVQTLMQYHDNPSSIEHLISKTKNLPAYGLHDSLTLREFLTKSKSTISNPVLEEFVWESPFRDDFVMNISDYQKPYEYIIGHVAVQKFNGGKTNITSVNNITDIDCGCATISYEKELPITTKTDRPSLGALAILRLDDMSDFYFHETISKGK